MISSLLIILFTIAGAAVIFTAALSPLETLSWWAGWTEDELAADGRHRKTIVKSKEDEQKTFIVYLSGVATVSGRFLVPREKIFVKELRNRFPGAAVIDGVFPYSPSGRPLLAAPRMLERLWRRLQKLKLQGRRTILSVMINIRNIYQVLISADHRYGPIFNQGAAHAIECALLNAGYPSTGGIKIILIGYSGGAQIALGAATFLNTRFAAPIDVVSIGGVVASDPGLHFVRNVYYITGDKDRVEKVGAVMFPERWAVLAHSDWNTAKRNGNVSFFTLKKTSHAGPHGYFGLVERDGKTNNERTLDLVSGIIEHITA